MKKKITFVIADLGSGGAQKVAVMVAEHWVRAGHEVSFLTLDNPKNDFHELSSSIRRVSLDSMGQGGNAFQRFFDNIQRIGKIRKSLQALQPDLVLSFIAPTNILAILASWRLNLQLVISERNDPSRQSFGTAWDFLRRLLYAHANIISANSKSAITAMKGYVPKHKLMFLPNPLPAAKPEHNPAIEVRENLILFTGRLHPQKSIDTLIKAFAQIENPRDWRLCIIGDGPLRANLENLAKNLNLKDRIEFTGRTQDPYPYYARAKIFVLPSLYEGTPNALLEAMSCGAVPIISNQVIGAQEFISNSEQIFDVGNEQSLALKLAHIMHDTNTLEIYRESALQNVKSLEPNAVFQIWDQLL